MKIAPTETEIVGRWVLEGAQIKGDEACRRIEDLVAHHLRILLDGGWVVLYEDPDDGRRWRLTYPEGHLHGGGPPRLDLLTTAAEKTLHAT